MKTHLTAEEVLQFTKFGINFGETGNEYVASKTIGVICTPNLLGDIKYDKLVLRNQFQTAFAIPAPNLQEVLNILPQKINSPFERKHLRIDNFINVWSIGYNIDLCFESENLLDAAIELLTYICENFPEILKITNYKSIHEKNFENI